MLQCTSPVSKLLGKFTVAGLISFGGIVFSLSCESTTDLGDDFVFPDSNVSFGEHVGAFFNVRCTGPCHAGATPAEGLDLTYPQSYFNLINGPQLVIPGNSNQSVLIMRLDGRIQPQMPLNSRLLTPNQLNGIRKWIDEGAQNN